MPQKKLASMLSPHWERPMAAYRIVKVRKTESNRPISAKPCEMNWKKKTPVRTSTLVFNRLDRRKLRDWMPKT